MSSFLTDAIEEVLEWAPRVMRMIPVFRDLWGAVKDDDAEKQLAAQMEMVRQMREAQAREEFRLSDPDETTLPGAE